MPEEPCSLRRGSLHLLAIGVLVLSGPLVADRDRRSEEPALSSSTAPADAPSRHLQRCRPGPWGALEYYWLFLDPSEEVLGSARLPRPEIEWRFVGWTRRQVSRLLADAGLGGDQQARLEGTLEALPSGGGTVARPHPELVASLLPTARARMYGVLARWDENPFQTRPLAAPSSDMDHWIEESGLGAPLRQRIRSLLYQRGGTTLFSDFKLLVPHLESREEQRSLLRLMYRERTLVLRLRVSSTEDLAEVARYWTGGGKSKNVLSLLESIARTPEVDLLDVVHLLPPTARMRLYSYPSDSDAVDGDFPDCHWTSLNFFLPTPNRRFLDPDVVVAELESRYVRVAPPYRFGDVLVLTPPGEPRNLVHSAVQIADDILFTKNGVHRMAPWILMRYDDLRARYAFSEPLEVRAYRKR